MFVPASKQASEEERGEDRERWGDAEYMWGEGLCEIGAGYVWMKGCDWLGEEKKEHAASCQTSTHLAPYMKFMLN